VCSSSRGTPSQPVDSVCVATAIFKQIVSVDTLRRSGAGCTDEGQAAERRLDTTVSKGCDLIVMASHGRHSLSALVLGSETVKVLTHSKIPVLVHR
jgi:nucleotide-binding universal stress UspA family protein